MKISVITAAYNSAQTIEDTLKSILAQTYTDYEYIIIDGCSKDDTLEIVARYEPMFGGRMHIVSEPDNGIYDAMNKGLKMSTGDVIGILNSDDFFTSEDVLEQVARTMDADKTIDAVYGDVHYVHSDNLKKCTRYYSSRLFSRSLMRFGFMPAHPSFYCRRELYSRHGMFNLDYKIAADFECLLRMIYIHRIRIKYIPLDFVTMRAGGASSSGFRSHRQILRDHLRALSENGVRSCAVLLSMRYIYKVMEIALSRVLISSSSRHRKQDAHILKSNKSV